MARSGAKKYRGNRTHGRGHKSGRGKGIRGGTGKAGLHKHKFMWMLKYDRDHFGRVGFKRPQKMIREKTVINLDEIGWRLPQWKAAGKVETKDGASVIDLGAMGYDKLLGRGKPDGKYVLSVPTAAAGAVAKVQEAGGKVDMTEPPEPAPAPAAAAAPPAKK